MASLIINLRVSLRIESLKAIGTCFLLIILYEGIFWLKLLEYFKNKAIN